MEEVYLTAWRRGLKATYYLFMAPRMHAEQSTVAVNKARRKPRWNLEGLNGHTEAVAEPVACEGEQCEVCQ